MGPRVLVVEDNRIVNDSVAEVLRSSGFDCLQAYDGLEALRTFEDASPDAIVLDLNLPKVHGLEVLRHVKQRRAQTLVVILTGQGSEQTAVRALKMGADDYLAKPVGPDRLIDALREGLDRRPRDAKGGAGAAACLAGREAELAALFLDAPTALFDVDDDGVVRSLNDAAARLVGRRPEEILGRAVEDLVDASIRGPWLESVRRDASDGGTYEGEVFLVGRGGSPVPAGIVALRRDGGGLVFAARDLTRQKALERQFFESKKLASLGRVVEGVAHEVRNPIIAIGGFARKLERLLSTDKNSRRYLDVILAEVQRLEQMVREIEDYVDLTAHRRPAFALLDVEEVLEGVLEEARSRCDGLGVCVDRTCGEGIPFMFGDRELLEELFRGLVDNALDAMPAGGRLRAETDGTGNWVRVHLGDNGVGIPEGEIEEIFNPFVTSKTSGAGLGLAKAYMIVEEHAGMIEFESEVGRGTVCTVSLPVDRRSVPRVGQ
ncbi:MAG: response regulator [Deltaproteobacteria bacterium]|nr:response regulator [Deltaproteobacteria bacterium]